MGRGTELVKKEWNEAKSVCRYVEKESAKERPSALLSTLTWFWTRGVWGLGQGSLARIGA